MGSTEESPQKAIHCLSSGAKLGKDYRLLWTCQRMLKSKPQKTQTEANQLNCTPEQSPEIFKLPKKKKKSNIQHCKIHCIWHLIKNYQACKAVRINL